MLASCCAPSSLRAAVGVEVALDEGAEGRDPSRPRRPRSRVWAARVSAVKGAARARATRAPSEAGGAVSQFFAPKRLANCQLLGSSVATAAAAELGLGRADARGRGGGDPIPQRRRRPWWAQARKENHFDSPDRLQFYSAPWLSFRLRTVPRPRPRSKLMKRHTHVRVRATTTTHNALVQS